MMYLPGQKVRIKVGMHRGTICVVHDTNGEWVRLAPVRSMIWYQLQEIEPYREVPVR